MYVISFTHTSSVACHLGHQQIELTELFRGSCNKVCVCVCVCVRVCGVHISVCMYVCKYVHVCMHYIDKWLFSHTFVMCVCRTHILCMYPLVCVCMYVHVCVHYNRQVVIFTYFCKEVQLKTDCLFITGTGIHVVSHE